MKCFTYVLGTVVTEGIKVEHEVVFDGELNSEGAIRSLVKFVPVTALANTCQCHSQSLSDYVMLSEDLANTACRFSELLFRASVCIRMDGRVQLHRESGKESNLRALVLLICPDNKSQRSLNLDPRTIVAGTLSRGCSTAESRENRLLVALEPGDVIEFVGGSEFFPNQAFLAYDGEVLSIRKELPDKLELVFAQRKMVRESFL